MRKPKPRKEEHRQLPCSEDTRQLGAQLGKLVQTAMNADTQQDAPPWLIHLSGELGAGKTRLAQGFFASMGCTSPVLSPTYSMANHYLLQDTAGRPVAGWHLDLYRIQSAADLEALGLDEMLLPGLCVLLVEWPEKAKGALPHADIRITLHHSQPGREAYCHLYSKRAEALWD